MLESVPTASDGDPGGLGTSPNGEPLGAVSLGPLAHHDSLTLAQYMLRYVSDRLRTGDIAPITAASLRHQLWPFVESFGRRPLDQLGRAAVDRWLQSIAHLRASTRASRLVALRGFAAWMVDNDHVKRDFTRGVPRIRRERREPRDIRIEHFVACLRACESTRETMVVWFAYGLGLRCVEISRLTVDDYDPTTCELYVVGKAGHQRSLPVPTIMRPILTGYVRERQRGPLIPNLTYPERPLSPSRVSKMVGAIAARTGLKVRPYDGFSAHGLRAGAASDIVDAAGGDLRVAQRLLGHSDLSSMARYQRRASQRKVLDALERRRYDVPDEPA